MAKEFFFFFFFHIFSVSRGCCPVFFVLFLAYVPSLVTSSQPCPTFFLPGTAVFSKCKPQASSWRLLDRNLPSMKSLFEEQDIHVFWDLLYFFFWIMDWSCVSIFWFHILFDSFLLLGSKFNSSFPFSLPGFAYFSDCW